MTVAPSLARAERQGEARHLRFGRTLFDRLEARLAASTLDARRGLALAAQLGAARGALSRRWPAAADVAALFGTPRFASRRIAFQIAAVEARNRFVLARTAGRPLAAFEPLVRWRDPAAVATLTPPKVLITAHLGALYLLSAGMDQLPHRRTILRWSPQHEIGPDVRNANLAGGLAGRTRALLDALAELRTEGFVSTTIDGGNGASVPVSVLGFPLDLGVGGFSIAKLAGVEVVPVAAYWESGGVVCELGRPVTDPTGAGRWLEAVLRRSPGQITLGLMRRLLFGPPARTPVAHPTPVQLLASE